MATAIQPNPPAADGALQYSRRHHRRHQPFGRPPSPLSPRVPAPPTNYINPLCNRTLSPERESPSDGSVECPRTPPPPRTFQPPCSCRRARTPPAGNGGGPECVMPLAGLTACGPFLTGAQDQTPTPQSECCSGLGAFLNASSTLRCLCPVILGDVNKMLPKPVDPIRMIYLPIACGVVLPPQVLYICFICISFSFSSPAAGRPAPAAVERFSQLWEAEETVSPALPP
ncbi:proline-rich receptor-like protein kinase PERK2 [Panicum hallii]|uniref:proline-rich receptor-like protein kinase PERK2 n=1 Tax=Panicum hallii TaxID=206008 RepID=UPI000DF4EC77|nr:proline-rich receptor-like protein kinase PERK2 [Panicum hallii]